MPRPGLVTDDTERVDDFKFELKALCARYRLVLISGALKPLIVDADGGDDSDVLGDLND